MDEFPGDERDEDVSDSRRRPSDDRPSLGMAPADDGVGLCRRGQQARDVAGVVLEIRVDGDHHIGSNAAESGPEGGGLAKVLLEPDEEGPRMVRRAAMHHLEDAGAALVRGAVVAEDDLPRPAEVFENGRKLEYLATNATRAHPKRERRIGRLRFGIVPILNIAQVPDS